MAYFVDKLQDKFQNTIRSLGEGLGPCLTNVVSYYNGDVTDEGYLEDLMNRGRSQALPGISLQFSGAQYVELDSTITLTGDFTINCYAMVEDSYNQRYLISNDTNYFAIKFGGPTTGIRIAIGGVTQTFTTLTYSVDTLYEITLEFDGNETATCTINDGVTSTSETLGGFSSTGNSILRMGWGGSTFYMIGTIYNIYAEDSTGTVLDLPLADGIGSTAVAKVGPNGTLNGFTLPDDWIESLSYGHLYNDSGYSLAQVNFWEASGSHTPVISGDTVTIDGTSDWGEYFTKATLDFSTPAKSLTFTCYFPDGSPSGMRFGIRDMAYDADVYTNVPSGFSTNSYYQAYIAIPEGTTYYSQTIEYPANVSQVLIGIAPDSGDTLTDFDIVNPMLSGADSAYVPPHATEAGKDAFGNSLSYPGPLAQNIGIQGYTGDFDGSTYIVVSEITGFSAGYLEAVQHTLDSSQNGNYRVIASYGPSAGRFLVGADNKFYLNTTDLGISVTPYLDAPHDYKWKIEEDGTCTELYIDGDLAWSGSVSAGTDGTLQFMSRDGGLINSGTALAFKMYNSSGVLTHHWPIESQATNSTQTTIFDVVGGNDATLTSATLPFFTVPFDYDENTGYLGRYGGAMVENLLEYSEDFSNAVWLLSTGVSVDGNLISIEASSASKILRQDVESFATYSSEVYETLDEVTLQDDYQWFYSEKNDQNGRFIGVAAELKKGPSGVSDLMVDIYERTTGAVNIAIGKAGEHDAADFYIRKVAFYADQRPTYIQTTDTPIPLSIAPYSITTKSFNHVLDAPDDLFLLNAPESPEFYDADTENEWIDTSGVVQDLAPEDITDSNTVNIGPDGLVVTSEAQTGSCLTKSNKYIGV